MAPDNGDDHAKENSFDQARRDVLHRQCPECHLPEHLMADVQFKHTDHITAPDADDVRQDGQDRQHYEKA